MDSGYCSEIHSNVTHHARSAPLCLQPLYACIKRRLCEEDEGEVQGACAEPHANGAAGTYLSSQCSYTLLSVLSFQSQETAADVDKCPICFDALTAPVVTACEHEFCKECLGAAYFISGLQRLMMRFRRRSCDASTRAGE
jgi:hypothetical protein